jgi:hypothetical protein
VLLVAVLGVVVVVVVVLVAVLVVVATAAKESAVAQSRQGMSQNAQNFSCSSSHLLWKSKLSSCRIYH